MASRDPNALQAMFARAEAAFRQDDYAQARALARELAQRAPYTAAVHHLLAASERRLDNLEASRAAFQAALRIAPDDAHINSNFANLLNALGEPDAAIASYRRALAKAPDFAEARLNMGLVLKTLDRIDEAIAAYEAVLAREPANIRGWQALGAARRDLGDLDAAAQAFDRVLALAPADPLGLLSRARVESDRGLSARAHFQRGVQRTGGQPDFALGHAVELLVEGETEAGLAEMEQITRATPGWEVAQSALARARWQRQGPEGFARGFEEALDRNPLDGPLWATYLRALARAGLHGETLARMDRARAALGPSRTLDLIEAASLSETGDIAGADRLFAPYRGDEDFDLRIALVRHHLRARRPDAAAALAEAMLGTSDDSFAIPFLGTAWRLLGDPRWQWLEGDERLVSTAALDVDLDGLAATLRTLHLTRFHPFDQSLRGGTQTEGPLFSRSDPAIRALRAAALAAVETHVAQLPPVDPAHPVLRRPRGQGRMRFTGSWSIRLAGSGFHVNHVHSEGWISSAFYVALPAVGDGADSHQGWLALGQPPAELDLGLDPVRLIRPEPGMLALFPSTMWHGTLPFDSGERLTVAFDAVPRL